MANARGSIDMKGIKAASQQATNYLSYDSTGIMISDLDGNYQTPSTATERNVFIDSTSVNIRDGQTNLATFSGTGVVVGETDKANIELTSNEIVATTDNGVEFFHIKSGEYSGSSEYQNSVEVENTYGTSQNFYGEANIAEDLKYNTTVNFVVNITYSGTSTSNTVTTEESYEYVSDEDAMPIIFGTVDFYNLGITVNMWTGSQKTIYINIVSETYTITNVVVDYTVTLSEYQAVSYTFGSRGINSDVGNKSFVCGDYLIASSANQFVVGKYNVEDADSTYAFIVGNGSDIGEYRSNAFAVKWSGDVETNAITLNENSLSEADNYIECVNANDAAVFKVVKSSGNTVVGGALVANSTATFNGDIIARSDLSVGDALTVGGTLTSTGKVTANNGLSVSGATSLDGSVTADGKVWIQGGSASGGNYNRIVINNGSPSDIRYGSGNRGTVIYSNGIAFADPKNGTSNTDAGWIRHIEDTANSGYLEIAVSDDGNEPVYVRQYNTINSVVKQVTLLDASGNTTFPGTVTTAGLNSTGNIRANSKALLTRSTKKYTDIGISANGSYYPASVKDISLSGYKPIAVYGIWVENNALASSANADASWCVVPSYWINSESSTLNFYIWNQHTSKSARVDIEFQVLYAADSIL